MRTGVGSIFMNAFAAAVIVLVSFFGLRCNHVALAFRFPIPSHQATNKAKATVNQAFFIGRSTKTPAPTLHEIVCSSTELRLQQSPNTSGSNDEDDEDEIDTTTMITTSTIALFSIVSSLGVFWSEVAVFQTSCGPLNMPDWLERSCYLSVLVVSGLSLFLRIITFGKEGLTDIILSSSSSLESKKEDDIVAVASSSKAAILRAVLQLAEGLAALAVLGAVVVLTNQVINGESMDGMSGIDLEKCRARQTFRREIM